MLAYIKSIFEWLHGDKSRDPRYEGRVEQSIELSGEQLFISVSHKNVCAFIIIEREN